MIADKNRTVHAFSSQWIGQQDGQTTRAIVYNQWSLAKGWTNPVDILLSPINEARLTDAILGRDGKLRVLFFGGNNKSADIYYSEAPVARAGEAPAWSMPVIIGSDAGDPEGAVMTEDNQGILHVLFNGRAEGTGLYAISSTDGGGTWSDPTSVFFADSDTPNIAQLHMITGKSGELHAIWNVYDFSGQGRGVYYAGSKDGSTWSEPVLLAAAKEGLGTQTPTLFEYQDTLFALFNLTPKIIMRQSRDSGLTWSDPSILFARHVGVNGPLALVEDGNEALHLFFGQRIPGTGGPDIHGLWHSMWINGRWIEPEAVIKGPRSVDKVGTNGFDPYNAHAVVIQGNLILVAWMTDPGDIKLNGVWYSYQILDAPELPAIPLPTVQGDLITNPQSLNPHMLPSPVGGLPTATPRVIDRSILLKGNGSTGLSLFGLILIVALPILLLLVILFRSKFTDDNHSSSH